MNVATSDHPEFQTMDSYRPGDKCILLTRSGVAIIGSLRSNTVQGYAGWAALPKIPENIKKLLYFNVEGAIYP